MFFFSKSFQRSFSAPKVFKFDSDGIISQNNYISFAFYNNYYNNINYDIPLNVEPCRIGKNINLKILLKSFFSPAAMNII